MALSHKHRTTIYQQWSPILGEEATEALLANFPARELDEPVTKEFVRAEISDVRATLRAEIADVRESLRAEVADVRAEIARLELRLKEYTGRRIAASTAFIAVLVTVFGLID